ncbi:MAG TPA: hypothetical protein VFZ04_04225, partial [Longimicrobiales bacterium]
MRLGLTPVDISEGSAAAAAAAMASSGRPVKVPQKAVEAFTRELAPLILTGPPSVTGFAGGRPRVQDIVAYWPALIDRQEIEPHLRVEVTEA